MVMTTLGVLSFTIMPPYGITIYHQNLLKQSINHRKKKTVTIHPTSGVLINSFGKMINSANMAIKLALV